MRLVRISAVVPLEARRVRLTLTDGTEVERDLSALLVRPVFHGIREDSTQFREVRVEAGALVWPNGADLCPDTVILGRVAAGRQLRGGGAGSAMLQARLEEGRRAA